VFLLSDCPPWMERMSTKLLIIEDDPDIAQIYVEIATNVGYEKIEIIYDGSGALHRLENHEDIPDVIFLDLFIPEVPGEDVLRKIRMNPYWKDVEVIVITASEKSAKLFTDHDESLPRADKTILKPFEFIDLANILRSKIQ